MARRSKIEMRLEREIEGTKEAIDQAKSYTKELFSKLQILIDLRDGKVEEAEEEEDGNDDPDEAQEERGGLWVDDSMEYEDEDEDEDED